jgi:hypothetical protein
MQLGPTAPLGPQGMRSRRLPSCDFFRCCGTAAFHALRLLVVLSPLMMPDARNSASHWLAGPDLSCRIISTQFRCLEFEQRCHECTLYTAEYCFIGCRTLNWREQTRRFHRETKNPVCYLLELGWCYRRRVVMSSPPPLQLPLSVGTGCTPLHIWLRGQGRERNVVPKDISFPPSAIVEGVGDTESRARVMFVLLLLRTPWPMSTSDKYGGQERRKHGSTPKS